MHLHYTTASTYMHIHYTIASTYMHIHYTIASTYMHTCMHAYMHTCIHACMHTCIHAYMHTCIHAYMHACIHAYMHICIHAYMHTCIHAYMHIHYGMTARSANTISLRPCVHIHYGKRVDLAGFTCLCVLTSEWKSFHRVIHYNSITLWITPWTPGSQCRMVCCAEGLLW